MRIQISRPKDKLFLWRSFKYDSWELKISLTSSKTNKRRIISQDGRTPGQVQCLLADWQRTLGPCKIMLNSKRDPLDPDAELFIYSPWNYTVIDSNNRVFGEFSPVYSQSGYIQRIYPGDKPTAKRQLHSIMNKSKWLINYEPFLWVIGYD